MKQSCYFEDILAEALGEGVEQALTGRLGRRRDLNEICGGFCVWMTAFVLMGHDCWRYSTSVSLPFLSR